jgi:tetratricopeptide (TPR) repeat protein
MGRLDRGELAQALQDIDRVVEINPRVALHWLTRADICAQLGLWDKARASLLEAEKLNPGDIEAPAELGFLGLLVRGDRATYSKGCADLWARFHGTTDPYIANTLVWQCVRIPDSRIPSAEVLELAERVLGKQKDADTMHTLAVALHRAGKHQAALQRFQDALQMLKGEATPIYWLPMALCYHHLGKKDEARKLVDQSLKWLEGKVKEKPAFRAGHVRSWCERQEMELLCQEAVRLIEGAGPKK